MLLIIMLNQNKILHESSIEFKPSIVESSIELKPNIVEDFVDVKLNVESKYNVCGSSFTKLGDKEIDMEPYFFTKKKSKVRDDMISVEEGHQC